MIQERVGPSLGQGARQALGQACRASAQRAAMADRLLTLAADAQAGGLALAAELLRRTAGQIVAPSFRPGLGRDRN